MKKLLSLLLCLILCLSLFACNSEAEKESTTKATTEATTETPQEPTCIIELSYLINKVVVKNKDPGSTVFNQKNHSAKLRRIYNYLNSFKLKKTYNSAMTGEIIVYRFEYEDGHTINEYKMSENNKIHVMRTDTYYEVLDEDYDPISFFEALCKPEDIDYPWEEIYTHPTYETVSDLGIKEMVLTKHIYSKTYHMYLEHLCAKFLHSENSLMIARIMDVLNKVMEGAEPCAERDLLGAPDPEITVYNYDGTETVYYIDVNYLKIYRNGQMEWYVLNKEAKEYLMDQIVTPLFEYGEE